MPRKLLALAPPVKQALSSIVALAGVLCTACGGAPPRPREVDLYGPRIANCVDGARGLSDAAQARMVVVAGGPGVLGSTEGERAQARLDFGQGGAKLFGDEAHVRRAFVHGFRLDRSPVTNELFAEFMAACGVLPPDAESLPQARWDAQKQRFGLHHDYAQLQPFLWTTNQPPSERERHPRVLVTQDDAGFYCAWRGARLPSEQEWERAARGPHGNAYPWGQRYDPYRVHGVVRGARDTVEVGSLPQGNSPEGFTDMGGLVFEWTASPWPGSRGYAVVKGNGWDGRGGYGRGAARVPAPVEMKDITLGFRCAADL